MFGAVAGSDPGPVRMQVEFPRGAGPIVLTIDITDVIGKTRPSIARALAVCRRGSS